MSFPKSCLMCATFRVKGVSCVACVAPWERHLLSIEGIKKASIDMSTLTLNIVYNGEELDAQRILDAVLSCPGCVEAHPISVKAARLEGADESMKILQDTQQQSTAILVLNIGIPLPHSKVSRRAFKDTSITKSIDMILSRLKQKNGVASCSILSKELDLRGDRPLVAIHMSIAYHPHIVGARTILEAARKAVPTNNLSMVPDVLLPGRLLENETRELKYVLSVCGVVACVVFVLSFLPLTHLPPMFQIRYAKVSIRDTIVAMSSFFVYMYGGYFFHKRAIQGILSHSFTMDLLISLSTTLTVGYTLLVLVINGIRYQQNQASGMLPVEKGDVSPQFFEMPALVVTFTLLGRFLEQQARLSTMQKTTWSLSRHHPLHPCSRQITDATYEIVPACLLHIEDIVKVKPREIIQHDAVLYSEHPLDVDESLLTGESRIITKHQHESIAGGVTVVRCKNHDHALYQVKQIGSETYMGRLEQLVNKCKVTRPYIERVADSLANWFIPVVLVVSFFTGVVWIMIFQYNMFQWPVDQGFNEYLFAIQRSIAVLAIACPCALGLANPMAIACGVARAAQFGVIVRNVDAFKLITEPISDIVFDKTGTLTCDKLGSPTVRVLPLCQWPSHLQRFLDKESTTLVLLWCAVSVQQRNSQHPITKSLRGLWNASHHQKTHALQLPLESTVYENEGIIGVLDFAVWSIHMPTHNPPQTYAVSLAVGNRRCMERANANMDHYKDVDASVFVACDRQCVGYIDLVDRIRPEAKKVIDFFQNTCGINVWICSGDTLTRALQVAYQVGVPPQRVKAQCSTEDKAQFIRTLKEESHGHRKVLMVGDGVNDAASVAEASIGMALGTDAYLTSTCADVVFLRDSLKWIVTFFLFCQYMKRKIGYNFLWAFFFNILAFPAAAGLFYPRFVLTPTWSGCCMAASSMAVIINSSLILYDTSFTPFDSYVTTKYASIFSRLYNILSMTRKGRYEPIMFMESTL